MGKGRYFFYLSNLIDVKKVLVYLNNRQPKETLKHLKAACL